MRRTSILEIYEVIHSDEWHPQIRRSNVKHLCERLKQKGYTTEQIQQELERNCPSDHWVMEAYQEFLDSLGVE